MLVLGFASFDTGGPGGVDEGPGNLGGSGEQLWGQARTSLVPLHLLMIARLSLGLLVELGITDLMDSSSPPGKHLQKAARTLLSSHLHGLVAR